MVLEVHVPSPDVFEAYWYGYGDVCDVRASDYESDYSATGFVYSVNYGTDHYRARCQQARFASGLYFARLLDNNGNETT